MNYRFNCNNCKNFERREGNICEFFCGNIFPDKCKCVLTCNKIDKKDIPYKKSYCDILCEYYEEK